MKQKTKENKDTKKVLVVDDHPIVCMGLSYLVNQEEDLVICGEARNAHEALEAIEALEPDVAIVDISLKGQSGIELVKNIKIRYPKLPILVFSIHDEYVYSEIVLRAGAKGYVMKQEANEKIITAIHRVLDKEIYLSERIASKILRKYFDKRSDKNGSPIELLSDRELEILRLIGQGYRNRQIAQELYLAIKTIETYRTHIRKKLKLKNSSELVKYAIQWTLSEMVS
ncbi:MAG: response regulator transcription factor [bacterium]